MIRLLYCLSICFFQDSICSDTQTCAENFESQLGSNDISWEQFIRKIIKQEVSVRVELPSDKQGTLRFKFTDDSYSDTRFFSADELSAMSLSDIEHTSDKMRTISRLQGINTFVECDESSKNVISSLAPIQCEIRKVAISQKKLY